MEAIASNPDDFSSDIPSLKKRIKYCKNPMERKSLERQLNDAYKAMKKRGDNMGCDIHVCCEYKNYEGKWINCDHFRLNPYYEEGYEDEPKMNIVPIFDNRNYALFATLAGVRNYGYVTPISDPRGLPDDVHPLTKKISDDWGSDGHSHSYYTLKELIDYTHTAPTVTYSGMITKEQAKDLDEYNIYPTSWCQWTSNEWITLKELGQRRMII